MRKVIESQNPAPYDDVIAYHEAWQEYFKNQRKKLVSQDNFFEVFGLQHEKKHLQNILEAAELEASRAIDFFEKGILGLSQINSLPPVSMLAFVCAMAKADGQTILKAKKIISSTNSKNAKMKSVEGTTYKQPLKDAWEAWQKDRKLFRNKAQLILSVEKSSGMKIRHNTAYDFISEWEKLSR